MSARTCAIIVGVVLMLGSAGAQPAREGQYLIERVGGQWEVREKGKDRPLADKYDVITTACQVRCKKAPCTLEYSTDSVAKPVFEKPPVVGRWLPVPRPTEPPVAPSAVDIQQLIAAAGVRGGAKKDSPTCGGDLLLLAPRCGELIDPVGFAVRWTPRPADAGKLYGLILGPTDSTDRRRWNMNADAGAFQSKVVQDYLTSLRLADRPTDISLRLMRTENLDAFRQVRLMGIADEAEYRRTLRTFDQLAELPRQLSYLQQYLKMEMWSKAAEISRSLLEVAPESLEIRKYALIGYCGSDFTEETARLRGALRDAGVKGICEPSASVK
jgi:hypothetical protein